MWTCKCNLFLGLEGLSLEVLNLFHTGAECYSHWHVGDNWSTNDTTVLRNVLYSWSVINRPCSHSPSRHNLLFYKWQPPRRPIRRLKRTWSQLLIGWNNLKSLPQTLQYMTLKIKSEISLLPHMGVGAMVWKQECLPFPNVQIQIMKYFPIEFLFIRRRNVTIAISFSCQASAIITQGHHHLQSRLLICCNHCQAMSFVLSAWWQRLQPVVTRCCRLPLPWWWRL